LKEIPRDLIGGGELRYRRTSGNEYVLYSVGWNQVDDGGYVADSPEKGDWVWGGGW
jgi:hypothetical protein